MQLHPPYQVKTLFLVGLLPSVQNACFGLPPSRSWDFLPVYIKEPFLNRNMHKYMHTVMESTLGFLWPKTLRMKGVLFFSVLYFCISALYFSVSFFQTLFNFYFWWWWWWSQREVEMS